MIKNGFSISVIVPVYNVEQYIEECIKSIISQSYTNFECLIIDDCGVDKSIEIAKSIVSQYKGSVDFRFIRNKKNQGVSVSRNFGIKESKGDFIFFVDADDFIYPHTLQNLIDAVKKHPEVDIVQGNINADKKYKCWNFDDGRFPEYTNDRDWISSQILLWNIPVTVWNKLCRRSFIVSHGIYFMEGFVHEDVMWHYDFQKHISSMAFVNDICYCYRTDNETSIMHNVNIDRTHSLLSYLELYKRAALKAETMVEKKFVFNLLSPMKIVSYLPNIKDVEAIKSKIDHTLVELQKSSTDKVFVRQLKMFKWPSFILDNLIFMKLYYIWGKKNGLA